jgi:hypothetical protein
VARHEDQVDSHAKHVNLHTRHRLTPFALQMDDSDAMKLLTRDANNLVER